MVGLVGEVSEGLLAELARSPNISLIRPRDEAEDSLEAGALALGEASRRMSPFALVAADPLAAVAAAWQAMWDLSQRAGDPGGFEQAAAAAQAAWRANRFELPDYYLALSRPGDEGQPAGQAAGFYLGPLRATRPRRVVAVVTTGGPDDAARVRHELRSLRHGPWWPPLPEVLGEARRFYAGGLAEGREPVGSHPADRP